MAGSSPTGSCPAGRSAQERSEWALAGAPAWRRRVIVTGAGVDVVVVATRTRAPERVGRTLLAWVADHAWDVPITPVITDRGYRRRPALFATYDMQPGDVIMLGDSITEMTDSSQLLPVTGNGTWRSEKRSTFQSSGRSTMVVCNRIFAVFTSLLSAG